MNSANHETLFGIDWYAKARKHPNSTYPLRIEGVHAEENSLFDESEVSIFGDVVNHESGCYEQRGLVVGPLAIQTHYDEMWHERQSDIPDVMRIPTFVDAPYASIVRCDASNLLLVESTEAFAKLACSRVLNNLGLIVMTGCGIPRLSARTLIKRLHQECGVSVHLLTDNDTWGYFIYSVMLRGAMAPHTSFPWAAVDKVGYVGIRAYDHVQVAIPKAARRPWKASWTLRMKALREYTCFCNPLWERELDAFEDQRFGINLTDYIDASGGADAFLEHYVAPRVNA